MIDVGLNHKYWQYAATMATFIRNNTPMTSNKGMESPFKAIWGQKPNLHNLPLFRCKSQVHVPHIVRGKLDPKTKECIFLEYAEEEKADVFEHVATNQRFVSHDAIVGSMRLNSKPIAGGPPTCQDKNQSTEVSFVQSKDDPYETKSPPTTEGSSNYTHEIYDDPLMGYQEMPTK